MLRPQASGAKRGRGRPPKLGERRAVPPAPKLKFKADIEVIELDSEDEEEPSYAPKGPPAQRRERPAPVRLQYLTKSSSQLPKKTVVAARKALTCLYRTENVRLTEGNKVRVHPFLGTDFLIVDVKDPAPRVGAKRGERAKAPAVREREASISPPPSKRTRIAVESKQEVPSVSKKSREQVQRSINLRDRATLKRKFGSSSDSEPEDEKGTVNPAKTSDSDSSSSSSSSSGSDSTLSDPDSDFEDENLFEPVGPKTRARGTVKDSKSKQEQLKPVVPPPKHFATAPPSRPLRKNREGKVYFSLKAKLSPNEYYKNEDLFVNWEKFVRNESEVGRLYKTMLMSANSKLVIFQLEKSNDKFVVERSVELNTNGTIEVTLKSEDVTSTFMKYVTIETNTHLNSLLSNLMNSHICPGIPNYTLINIKPDAILKDEVWFSRSCTKIVFHEPSVFSVHKFEAEKYYNEPCPSCKELRKQLQKEATDILNQKKKEKLEKDQQQQPKTKGRNRAKQERLVFGKYKPPEVKKMQVRQSLSDLFLGFWKALGYKEEEYPKETTDIKVDTVTEKDFEKPKEPPPPPPLPESIPILENIEFGDDGKTHLTFGDIPLNPYATSNVVSMLSHQVPDFPAEMINSIINTDDPESLLRGLEGLPDCQEPFLLNLNQLNSNEVLEELTFNEPESNLMFPTFSLTDL